MELEESSLILSDLLMKLIHGERDIEYSRKSLSDLYTFNPHSLFNTLAKVYRTSITPRDLKDFLQENGAEVSDEEVYLVVRQYSADQNGRLSFEDFSHLVLPSTNELIARLAQNRLFPEAPDEKVRFYFKSLLSSEVKLQQELEHLKQRLFSSTGFSLWKSFEYLNSSGSGAIDEEEVRDFLRKFKNYITAEDYDALMRRIDLGDDLVINYNEFLEGLIPMQMSGDGESRIKNLESNESVEKIEEKQERQESEEKQEVEEQNCFTDEPLDSQELEKSPKFNDPKEFTLSGQFETPEKSKGKSKLNRKLQEHLDKLAEIWVKELEVEKKYEFLRENLIMQSNFSITKLFELIDNEAKGEICMLDFENFLKSLNIPINKNVIFQLFSRYANTELNISPEELFSLFACQDEEYCEILKNTDNNEPLQKETIERISEYFSFLLENEENISKLKDYFSGLNMKELQEVFEGFDLDQDGLIDGLDLKKSLLSFGMNCAGKDLRSLMRRYSDEAIDFNDFCKNITLNDEIEDS